MAGPKLCRIAIQQAVKRHSVDVSELCIADDHVHVVVEPPVDMCIAHCAKVLESVSAQVILEEQPGFRKIYDKGFWSTGYTYRSVGDTANHVVEKYVAEHNINQANLAQF